MNARVWIADPANFPGRFGALMRKFIQSRMLHRNVTDSTVVWYCSSWIAFREQVSQAKDESDLRQKLHDGIMIIARRNLKPNTVNCYVRCMQAFTNWLLELEYIKRPIRLPKQKVEERILKVLSDDEVQRIVDFRPTSEAQERIHCATVLMLDAGLRAQEWINLRPNDVDFQARTVRVFGKGRRERLTPMSELTSGLLHQYLATRKCDYDYVFATRNGTPMSKRSALRMLKRLAISCGVTTSLNLHGCRHTMASIFAGSGGNLAHLQKILGHRSITTTMRYVHTQIEDAQREHRKHSPIARLKKKQ